ncbi:unnamed protein product [Mytilus coruscus]|uniref:Uncharacterized protein n=1 Tax=Mytilus coruscus TaxID=42192 RepID=A0A6J8AMU1_MYTCO|nr:unnamed protein product [Mytilus coruscus]
MLAITFGENVFEHEVVVGGVRNNLIITAYRCIWDHDEFSFIINGRRIPLETSKEAVSKKVIALETVMVPGGHEAIIRSGLTNRAKFRRSPSSLGILTPERPFLERHGLALAKTLEDAANEIVFARVYHPGSTEVRVYKHTHIALFTPVCKVGPVLNMNLLDVLEFGEEDISRSFGALPEHLYSMFGKSCEHLDDDQQAKFKAFITENQEWVNIRSSSLDEKPVKEPPRRIPMYKRQALEDEVKKLEERGLVYSSLQKVGEEDTSRSFGALPEHLCSMFGRSCEHFDDDQQAKFKAFITENQECFARPGEVGRTNVGEHKIKLTDEKPVKEPPRRIPMYKRQALKDEVKKLEERGLIEKSESPWSSQTVKPKRRTGVGKEVSFFGHIVLGEGIRTDPAKVVAVRDIKRPTTVTQVRSFLGLASYYRKYVKYFSKAAKPLFDLKKKDLSGMKEPKKFSAT